MMWPCCSPAPRNVNLVRHKPTSTGTITRQKATASAGSACTIGRAPMVAAIQSPTHPTGGLISKSRGDQRDRLKLHAHLSFPLPFSLPCFARVCSSLRCPFSVSEPACMWRAPCIISYRGSCTTEAFFTDGGLPFFSWWATFLNGGCS